MPSPAVVLIMQSGTRRWWQRCCFFHYLALRENTGAKAYLSVGGNYQSSQSSNLVLQTCQKHGWTLDSFLEVSLCKERESLCNICLHPVQKKASYLVFTEYRLAIDSLVILFLELVLECCNVSFTAVKQIHQCTCSTAFTNYSRQLSKIVTLCWLICS